MAGYGVGASLQDFGASEQKEATGLMADAAKEENDRNIANDNLEQQRKQGNKELGATVGAAGGFAAGAEYGSSAGPWGALIGGIVGGIAGGLF